MLVATQHYIGSASTAAPVYTCSSLVPVGELKESRLVHSFEITTEHDRQIGITRWVHVYDLCDYDPVRLGDRGTPMPVWKSAQPDRH